MTALSAREIDGEPIIRIAERLIAMYPPKPPPPQYPRPPGSQALERQNRAYRLVIKGPGADRKAWLIEVKKLKKEMIAAGQSTRMLPRRATYNLPHLQRLARGWLNRRAE